MPWPIELLPYLNVTDTTTGAASVLYFTQPVARSTGDVLTELVSPDATVTVALRALAPHRTASVTLRTRYPVGHAVPLPVW